MLESELMIGFCSIAFVISLICACRLLVQDIDSYRDIEIKHILMFIISLPTMLLFLLVSPFVIAIFGFIYILDKYEDKIKKPFKYKPFDKKDREGN